MDVTFTRTGDRRYSTTAAPDGGERLVVHPSPGYDPHLPHDLLHLLVERHWRLRNGIYGQVARGGNAGSFLPESGTPTKSWNRAMAKRNAALARAGAALRPGGPSGPSDMARSEALVALAQHAWLRRERAAGRPKAARPRDGATLDEATALAGAFATRAELDALMPQMDAAAARWTPLPVGGAMTENWPA